MLYRLKRVGQESAPLTQIEPSVGTGGQRWLRRWTVVRTARHRSGSSGSDRRDRHHSLNHRRHQQLLRDHIHHNLHNSHHQNNNNTNPAIVNTNRGLSSSSTTSSAATAVIDIDAAINRLACRFSHDTDLSVPIPETVCWYYLYGHCMFGESCRFVHLDAAGILANHYHQYEAHPPASASTAAVTATNTGGQTAANTGRTYAQMAHTVSTGAPTPQPPAAPPLRSGATSGQLCPYAAQSIEGLCPYPEGQCHYTHGVMCELCGHHCLHPDDRAQQARHRDECVREHEREMELSFAVQRSLDKACGICMDIVFEKEPATERRFGILQSCSHIFCLSCIRKWRQTKQFENRTIRACPECRVPSDFVIPSKYWYDDRSEKDSLIESYKQALSTKPCKYFQQGRGECPFAGACFYLHAGPDGRRVEMPPPRQQRRRANQEGELETLRDMLLWNYLEVRDDNHWLLTLDLEDVFDIQEMGLLSGYDTDDDDEEDDDSDISDFNSADVIG
ncbi:unnamed protein product [Medioppia subpectinata]|uniref:RING-type E3 ubiquitin transferase n=1 Tax=Medioppia subpectinata TaxID=1979941 RepID=A0A7R9L578_9ACAR|nr:unnamed protein product [Medioppia subpectinata]CAG2115752.1 unnamed protein product [Medioppia subpectinata]